MTGEKDKYKAVKSKLMVNKNLNSLLATSQMSLFDW